MTVNKIIPNVPVGSSLPAILELKVTLRIGAFSCLRSLTPSAVAVIVTLEEIWTLWMMPLPSEQKWPILAPLAAETSADMPLHSCIPGTDWYRLPWGDLSSTECCSGIFKTQVTWLSERDRQESIKGMVRGVPCTGHKDKLWHSERWGINVR